VWWVAVAFLRSLFFLSSVLNVEINRQEMRKKGFFLFINRSLNSFNVFPVILG